MKPSRASAAACIRKRARMNSARDARHSSRTSGHASAALRRLVARTAVGDGGLSALVGGSAGFSDGGDWAKLVAGPAAASAAG